MAALRRRSTSNPVTCWAGGAKAWQKRTGDRWRQEPSTCSPMPDTEGRKAARGIAAALHKLGCTVELHLPSGGNR